MQASPPAMWRRSSYSGDGNNCVEVADLGGGVAVRDSKNPAGLPVTLPPAAWRALVRQVKADHLDL